MLMALAALCCVGAAAAQNEYTWTATPGPFSVNNVVFESAMGAPWGPGCEVNVELTGMANKMITAGTVKFQLYEEYVPKFEASGNEPYFKCDNKGCDTSSPVTLFLEDPTADKSPYQLRFTYVMGEAEKTGDFSLVVWGVDQDHTPYDFSVSIGYNYTSPAGLRGAVRTFAPTPMAESTGDLPFKYNVTNGAMVIDSVTATSTTGSWQAGASVTISMTGEIASKHILAGTLKWKIYEMGVRYFISEAFSPYFSCNNKGCNPFDGIALKLNDPTTVPTSFVATFTFTVPREVKGGNNEFKIVAHGEDQDHQPADFILNLDYILLPGRL